MGITPQARNPGNGLKLFSLIIKQLREIQKNNFDLCYAYSIILHLCSIKIQQENKSHELPERNPRKNRNRKTTQMIRITITGNGRTTMSTAPTLAQLQPKKVADSYTRKDRLKARTKQQKQFDHFNFSNED